MPGPVGSARGQLWPWSGLLCAVFPEEPEGQFYALPPLLSSRDLHSPFPDVHSSCHPSGLCCLLLQGGVPNSPSLSFQRFWYQLQKIGEERTSKSQAWPYKPKSEKVRDWSKATRSLARGSGQRHSVPLTPSSGLAHSRRPRPAGAPLVLAHLAPLPVWLAYRTEQCVRAQ